MDSSMIHDFDEVFFHQIKFDIAQIKYYHSQWGVHEDIEMNNSIG